MSIATALGCDAADRWTQSLADEFTARDHLPDEAAKRIAAIAATAETYRYAVPGQHWVLHPEFRFDVNYWLRPEIVIQEVTTCPRTDQVTAITFTDADDPTWVITRAPDDLDLYVLHHDPDPGNTVDIPGGPDGAW